MMATDGRLDSGISPVLADLGQHLARLGPWQEDGGGLLRPASGEVVLVTAAGERLAAAVPADLTPEALWRDYRACDLFASAHVVWYESRPLTLHGSALVLSTNGRYGLEGQLIFPGTSAPAYFDVRRSGHALVNGEFRPRYLVDLRLAPPCPVPPEDRVLRRRLAEYLATLLDSNVDEPPPGRGERRDFSLHNLFTSRPDFRIEVGIWGEAPGGKDR